MADNVLYYGDNLDVMRRHIADESVDRVYLEPAFILVASIFCVLGFHSA